MPCRLATIGIGSQSASRRITTICSSLNLDLRSEQVERVHGVVHPNPEGREQNKKHRAIVKLPKTLRNEAFQGWLIIPEGEHAKGIKTAWRAAVRRAGLDPACRPYSLRRTAAR